MAFRFRFPIAILHYLKSDGIDDKKTIQNAIEKAREWAVPLEGETRQRPTLQDAADWVNKVIEDDRTRQAEVLED